jgi:CDP-diacylglycerol--serine O-phosphatidyltransferase
MVLGQRRRRVRLSAQPLRNLIPNMITILALCAGMTGVRYGLDGRFELAVSLIVAAAVLDGLDGRSARMLNSTSKIGAELDSLADFLSFGVAPALLVYLWTLDDVRGVGWAVGMLYATCCALRLARFNSETDLPDRPRWTYFFFTGIPAPAAAGLALTPMMLSFVTGGWTRSWPLNAAVLVFVAVMMVSRVPTFALKRVRVQPDMVLPTLLIASVVIAGLVVDTWLTLSVIAIVYVLSIPFSAVAARRLRRRDQPATATPAPAARPAAASATPATVKPTADRVVSFEPRPGQRPG